MREIKDKDCIEWKRAGGQTQYIVMVVLCIGHGIDINRHYAIAQYINSIQFNVDLQHCSYSVHVGVQNMPYCIIILF